MNDKFEKMAELMEDEEQVKEVFLDDIDRTLDNLYKKGIELTKEEFIGFVNGVMAEDADGELTEGQLEDVAGGGSVFYIIGYEKGLGYASEGKCKKAKWWWPKSYKNGFKDGQVSGGCV